MNVLYLHSHDTGRYIQPYGYPVATPHLQALAESGVLFRDAHCAAPTCSPSRAALLTGEYAHSAGMVALAHRGGKIWHPERHLASFLASHRYETVCAGFSHVGKKEAMGYTKISGCDWKQGEDIADYCVDYLKHATADQPFFLDAGFVETHRTEWVCHGFNQDRHDPKDGDGNADYLMPPATLPDTPETRRDWLDYCHSATRLDEYYGRILAALDASGLAENTLVIATTDHGIPFPHHKCKLTAHGTGVLMVLRAPGLPAGQVSDALVSQIDFYPTLCDLLQLPHPDWLQGRSLLPLVRGEVAQLHEAIFSEVTFHGSFEPKRSVRTKRWNYIRNFAGPYQEVMPNCDDGHSKRLLLSQGMSHRTVPKEELYDLTFDPQERSNLALDPSYAATKRELRERLKIWMQETADPLLSQDPTVMPLPQYVSADLVQPGGERREWDPEEWVNAQHEL